MIDKQKISKATEISVASVLVATLVLTACGGSGGDTPATGSSATGTTVVTTPSLGQLASGSKVILRDRNGDQIGEGFINGNGVAEVTIPSNANGPFLLEAGFNGDRYFDEKTAGLVQISGVANPPVLRTFLPTAADAASGVAITALTSIAATRLLDNTGKPQSGVTAASAVGANNTIASLFGLNNLLSPPTLVNSASAVAALSSNTDAGEYAIKLAAISHMAGTGEEAHDVALRLAADLKTSSAASAVNAIIDDFKTTLNQVISDEELDPIPNDSYIPIPDGKTLEQVVEETAIIESSSSSIATAKALLTSLRTNASLVSNNQRQGFIDLQAGAIEQELSALDSSAGTTIDTAVADVSGAIELLQSGAPAGTLNSSYYENVPCVVTVQGSQAVCQWFAYQEYGSSKWMLHQLTISQNSLTQYGWSEGIIGYGDWQSSNPSTGSDSYTIQTWSNQSNSFVGVANGAASLLNSYAARTGTIGVGVDGMGKLNSMSINGQMLPDYPSNTHYYTGITLNANLSKNASDNTATATLSGSIGSFNSAGSKVIGMAINQGSTATWNTNSSDGGENLMLKTTFETSNYAFNGNLGISNNSADTIVVLSFDGDITGKSAAVGKFISGNFSLTHDESSFNKNLNQGQESSSNFTKDKFEFTGNVTDNGQSPARSYTVNLVIDGTLAYKQEAVNLTYTDPSGKPVTVTGTNYRDNSQTDIWVANMSGIYIKANKVYAAPPETGTLIGTINKGIVSFIDGSYVSM